MICIDIILDPFESRLNTWSFFTPKYLSVFLKNKDILLYKHCTIVIVLSVNIETILFIRFSNLISILPIMSVTEKSLVVQHQIFDHTLHSIVTLATFHLEHLHSLFLSFMILTWLNTINQLFYIMWVNLVYLMFPHV